MRTVGVAVIAGELAKRKGGLVTSEIVAEVEKEFDAELTVEEARLAVKVYRERREQIVFGGVGAEDRDAEVRLWGEPHIEDLEREANQ
jgi:hypothetical protein